MARRPFPFAPLPPGEATPAPGSGDYWKLVARDKDIIRWFVEEWFRRPIPPESPLGWLLAAYDAMDPAAPVPALDQLARENARYALYLVAHFTRLAWAIRALHGRADACDWVDGSFADELLGEDSAERDAELRKLPGGVGTLVLAGRLLQSGGGHLRVKGKGAAGHDIRWTTGRGDLVLVERKDRSYDAGLDDTLEDRVRTVTDRLHRSHFPLEQNTVRILSIGFSHLVSDMDTAIVDPAYEHAVRAFRYNHSPRLPHFVLVEHLGLEPRSGGAKRNFFSPQFVREPQRGTAEDRVARLLLRACGQAV